MHLKTLANIFYFQLETSLITPSSSRRNTPALAQLKNPDMSLLARRLQLHNAKIIDK
jgi:hypothetical protein